MERQKRNITDFMKNEYKAYFGMELGDQDKTCTWAPHIVCKTCVESLRGWTNGMLKLKFALPMVWREPKNHFNDCYFCLSDMTGINKNTKKAWKYPNLESAIRPVVHSEELPVPVFLTEPDTATTSNDGCSDYKEPSVLHGSSQFNQSELDDLVRDICLSKDQSEILASRLQKKIFCIQVLI